MTNLSPSEDTLSDIEDNVVERNNRKRLKELGAIKPTLFIIRGINGSGKTSLARRVCPARTVSDTDYFQKEADRKDDSYKNIYDESQEIHAYNFCLFKVEEWMQADPTTDICVANPFTEKDQFYPYINLADEYGFQVSVIRCENYFGNTHAIKGKEISKQYRELKKVFKWTGH